MNLFSITLFLVLLIPNIVLASVRITEIAWMGISGSNGQYGEWLELYNDGNESVNLSGWKLYTQGGDQLVFTLTKSISSKGYLIIERTTVSMPDPILEIDDESGPFGGGGLSNNGEDLILKDKENKIIENLLFSSGWPAGDSVSKQTMQLNNSKWVTLPVTPKYGYSEDSIKDTNIINSVGSSNTQNSRIARNEPRIEFSFPNDIYRGIDYEFKINPILEYNNPYFGVFKWNMGDGKYIVQKYLEPIHYIYKYPGKYIVSFAYYRSDYDSKPVISGTKNIEVLDPIIEIFNEKNSDFLEIKNLSEKSIDISNWKIQGTDLLDASLPPMTLIAAKTSIKISLSLLGIKNIDGTKIALISPNGESILSSKVSNVSDNKSPSEEISNNLNYIENKDIQFDSKESIIENVNEVAIDDEDNKKNTNKVFIFGTIVFILIIMTLSLEYFMQKVEKQKNTI